MINNIYIYVNIVYMINNILYIYVNIVYMIKYIYIYM